MEDSDSKVINEIDNRGRHAGRAGWRYDILGPTESGKTTLAVRILKDWEKQNPNLPIYSNIRIFNVEGGPSIDEGGHTVLDPRVKIYHDPAKEWPRMKNGLVFCDEMSNYLNSLPGYTDNRILKVLLDLARNLMKQDCEIIATDQPSRGIHKRFRMNFNRFYAPTMDERFNVSYLAYDTLDDYEEKNLERAKGPFRFNASEVKDFFDTKEIVVAKPYQFKPEKELEKMVKWFRAHNLPFDPEPRMALDQMAYYQTRAALEWSIKQERSIKFLITSLYQSGMNDGQEKDEE